MSAGNVRKTCRARNVSGKMKLQLLKKGYIIYIPEIALMGKRRGKYKVLLGNPERKRPLGRTRHRWLGSIKMDLQEVGWGGGAWTGLIWLRIGTGGGHLYMW